MLLVVERLLGLGSQKTATSPSSFLPPLSLRGRAREWRHGLSQKAYISVDEEINQIISGLGKGSTERAFLAAAL